MQNGKRNSALSIEGKNAKPTLRVMAILLAILSFQFLYFIVSTLQSCETDPKTSKEENERLVYRIRPADVPADLDLDKLFHRQKMPIEDKMQQEITEPLPEGVSPRVFEKWTRPFPCFEPEADWWSSRVQRSRTKTGFFFMKEMKTGSSTLAGVHLRISKNVARRLGSNYRTCKSRFDHALAIEVDYAHRDKQNSFLWTVLREPTTRATSQFFHFAVSRMKIEPSDANFKKELQHFVFEEYYIKSLSTKSQFNRTIDVKESVANILKDYDFIGIMERMDETLVVLSLLLNIPLSDVLYLKAKGNGGFDDGRFRKKCVYIVPPYVSPTMEAYFASPSWKTRIRADDYLYRLANKSLDMTIEALGKDLVARTVEEYKQLRSFAEQECADKVQYPCTSGGARLEHVPGCLWQDSGCGNPCLDKVTHMVQKQTRKTTGT